MIIVDFVQVFKESQFTKNLYAFNLPRQNVYKCNMMRGKNVEIKWTGAASDTLKSPVKVISVYESLHAGLLS